MADTDPDRRDDYAEAPERVAPANEGRQKSRVVLTAEWARNELSERSAYVVSEVTRRPWQSSTVFVSVFALLCGLIALSAPWLSLRVDFKESDVLDISTDVDLSHVVACSRQPRTTTRPGLDCDIYAIGDAPTNLNELAVATGTALAFTVISFLVGGLMALGAACLRRMDRTSLLGVARPYLASKRALIGQHAFASFFYMVAFAAYSGAVNPFLTNAAHTALLTRGVTPTSVWYGAGFAFTILGWLAHAAASVMVWRTPEQEEIDTEAEATRSPHVGSGAGPNAAAPHGAVAIGEEDGGPGAAYAAPLTGDDGDEEAGGVQPRFGGTVGDDDDDDDGDNAAAAATADNAAAAQDDDDLEVDDEGMDTEAGTAEPIGHGSADEDEEDEQINVSV